MKTAQLTTSATPVKKNVPFFSKENEQNFFHPKAIGSSVNEQPFFSKGQNNFSGIQRKCATCEKEDSMIQRQEQPDESVTKTDTPDPNNTPATTPTPGFRNRAGKCKTTPEFPNFGCFTQALKLDIDENLWNNAHQFYRVATLYPDDKDLMWNTFLRYGLGVNLLKTSFGFLGANKTLGTALSYGTGIALKSFGLLKSGKLEIDYQYNLGKDLNLDFKLDLNADPNNLSNVKGVDAGIGISGHF